MVSDLNQMLNLILTIFYRGGWIGFAVGLLYMFYKMYMDYIQFRWYSSIDWIFLKITVPRENEKSPLTFEQIMNQLHSIHGHHTWAERHIEGEIPLWFTWELVSVGGVITNYVKIARPHRDTLEAAIYSQFPNAEIEETQDYLANLPRFNQETSEYDIFALNFKLANKEYYPIRTYLDFEHASTKTFVDPVTGVWEELGKISPYELVILQYMFRPEGEEWKEGAEKIVEELKGVHHTAPTDILTRFVSAVTGPILDILIRRPPSEGGGHVEESEKVSLAGLTDAEKGIMIAIQEKAAKLAYDTKIRFVYLAPKEKYNPTPVRTAIAGAFKSVGSQHLNMLIPNTHTWTKVHYWLFEHWEHPIVQLRLSHRKRNLMRWTRNRWFMGGQPPFILNTAEIATILHFPQIEVVVPQIEQVKIAKIQPPSELPIVPEI